VASAEARIIAVAVTFARILIVEPEASAEGKEEEV
jgi:hypothetical protein